MYSTTNTYAMKRDIIGFSEKLSAGLYRPDCKFTADMLYGLLASGSYLLTDIAGRECCKRGMNTMQWYLFYAYLYAVLIRPSCPHI